MDFAQEAFVWIGFVERIHQRTFRSRLKLTKVILSQVLFSTGGWVGWEFHLDFLVRSDGPSNQHTGTSSSLSEYTLWWLIRLLEPFLYIICFHLIDEREFMEIIISKWRLYDCLLSIHLFWFRDVRNLNNISGNSHSKLLNSKCPTYYYQVFYFWKQQKYCITCNLINA